ncbi:hypothetical protein DY000_02040836 [Brassica cretica]|uniref:Uncharacterized protein n=1 Tax=Brassica cretica TaxID=69181 RepID=A0ABQ7BHX4_BRACR|nr:hypothetical protein DY000_02040836 [Brassica cretica]
MSDTHNHGEEISADTYARLMRHQFNLESLGDRLQKIEDATTIMKDKWRRGDEAMRDFTDSTKDTKVDQLVNYVTLAEIVSRNQSWPPTLNLTQLLVLGLGIHGIRFSNKSGK